MYFSDQIELLSEEWESDNLNQYENSFVSSTVWCDLTSISSNEQTAAGVNGHTASGRAIVHLEDYNHQKIVRYSEDNPVLPKGLYDVYRTFVSGDCIELYLIEREGLNGRRDN